jgi:hypothetical protein
MTEKLKAAVREAMAEWHKVTPDRIYDNELAGITLDLFRRGVVVQGDVRKIDSDPCLAKAREDEDAFIILARDPVGCLVLNFWCDQRATLIGQGILPDNEQEWQHIQQVRDKAKVFLEYEPKSYGKGAGNSSQTPPAPVFEEEPPSDGSNWRSTRLALTPLTYAQACVLPVWSEVVCLDVGRFTDYSCKLTKGQKYKVVPADRGTKDACIDLGSYNTFCLNQDDCHLFAAVPPASAEGEKSSPVITDQLAEVNTNAAGESPAPAMSDEEIGREMLRIYDKSISSEHRGENAHYTQIGRRARELLQPDSFTEGHLTFEGVSKLVARAEKAEAALEALRREAQEKLRGPEDHPYASGVKHGLRMAVRAAGFIVHPEVYAQPAKPLRVEVAP